MTTATVSVHDRGENPMENTYMLDTRAGILHESTCPHAWELVRAGEVRTFDAARLVDIWENWVKGLSQEPPVRTELPLDCPSCFPTGDERPGSDRVARAVLTADSPEGRAQMLSRAADRVARVRWIALKEGRRVV